MALKTGTRLGPYEILGSLGAGGMGEVYRAKDTKLNRDVALKIVPELFTTDADRLARFKREAQVLASLKHPNIAAIYRFKDGVDWAALPSDLPPARRKLLRRWLEKDQAPAERHGRCAARIG